MNIKEIKDIEIGQLIKYCRLMVGINISLSSEQKQIMLEYIKEEYADLDEQEIKDAFKSLSKGGVEIPHYNNMNPMYFSKVLNAYFDKKNGTLAERLANPSKFKK